MIESTVRRVEHAKPLCVNLVCKLDYVRFV